MRSRRRRRRRRKRRRRIQSDTHTHTASIFPFPIYTTHRNNSFHTINIQITHIFPDTSTTSTPNLT